METDHPSPPQAPLPNANFVNNFLRSFSEAFHKPLKIKIKK